MSLHLVTLKDLASEMQLHPRSVKRIYKELHVPPTIPGHAAHRWTVEDAERLLRAWAAHWNAKRRTPKTT